MEHIDAALPSLVFQVDFSWKKFRALVTDPAHPKDSIIVHCSLTKPQLEFRNYNDDQRVGTGSVNYLKIDSEVEIRGTPIHIKALQRFVTGYTHASQAYAKGRDRMAMTWTSGTNFKHWDFVCLDDDHQPVARFSSNVWALRKLGMIEFMGDKANDRAAREEIVIVGLTIYYTMLMRFENPLQLFGAVVSKPGYPKKEAKAEHALLEYEASSSGREMDTQEAETRSRSKDGIRSR